MPDIKLKNASGVEQVYTGVDTITVPLADGTGTWTFGFTDEDLVFTTGGYVFYKDRFSNVRDDSRVKFRLANSVLGDSLIYTFAESKATDLSHIDIYFENPANYSTNEIEAVFYNATDLIKLPVITNTEKIQINGNRSILFGFGGCHKLQEEEMKKWLNYFINTSTFQTTQMFNQCFSMRDGSWVAEYTSPLFAYKFTSTGALNQMFGRCRALETLVFPVLNKEYETIFNLFPTGTSAIWYECNRLSSLSCEVQEDGTPYVTQWKNQTIDMTTSSSAGYIAGSVDTAVQQLNQSSLSFDMSKNIFYGYEDASDNSSRMELWAQRYQEVKNDPDWMSWGYGSTSYDGSTVSIAILYSRYNHDSMVETINSLPDTSAYLASAGGTNTIKFSKYCGALTDAGGPEQLTDAEIAVATAKGWTVTIV